MSRRWWFSHLPAGLLIAGLAGCAGAPPVPLSKDQISRLRLDAVTVSVAPDAAVSWANAENDFVAQQKAAPGYKPKSSVVETGALGTGGGGDSEHMQLAASPEAKAYVQERAAASLRTALEQSVKPALQGGSQPVRLEVTIKSFQVPSAVQRVIVGGVPVVAAEIELKDAQTGAVLAKRPDFVATAYAGNGIGGVLIDQALDDPDQRLAVNFAETYRDWITGKTGGT